MRQEVTRQGHGWSTGFALRPPKPLFLEYDTCPKSQKTWALDEEPTHSGKRLPSGGLRPICKWRWGCQLDGLWGPYFFCSSATFSIIVTASLYCARLCGSALYVLTQLVFTPAPWGAVHRLHFGDEETKFLWHVQSHSGDWDSNSSSAAPESYPNADRELCSKKSCGCFSLNILTIRIKKAENFTGL